MSRDTCCVRLGKATSRITMPGSRCSVPASFLSSSSACLPRWPSCSRGRLTIGTHRAHRRKPRRLGRGAHDHLLLEDFDPRGRCRRDYDNLRDPVRAMDASDGSARLGGWMGESTARGSYSDASRGRDIHRCAGFGNRLYRLHDRASLIVSSALGALTCYPKCDQALCETSACQTVWA
jgi:hypothetical protein